MASVVEVSQIPGFAWVGQHSPWPGFFEEIQEHLSFAGQLMVEPRFSRVARLLGVCWPGAGVSSREDLETQHLQGLSASGSSGKATLSPEITNEDTDKWSVACVDNGSNLLLKYCICIFHIFVLRHMSSCLLV